MISDYRILGISDDSDASEIKKAYKRKVKELHPDVSDETTALKNHCLFIEVCKAYERLCNVAKAGITAKAVDSRPVQTDKTITRHGDPAYVYYKTGCKYFERIHPSHWNLDSTITVNGKTKDEIELQDKTMAKVKDLVALFPKAYYYFSIVVHEYPDSVWINDSKEKMRVIERRIKT